MNTEEEILSELICHWIEKDSLSFRTITPLKKYRPQLIGVLANLTSTEQDQLIVSLEGCICHYKAWRQFEKNNTPGAKSRKELAELIKATNQLDKALRGLSWGARRVVAPYLMGLKRPTEQTISLRKPVELEQFDQFTSSTHTAILNISKAAKSYLKDSKKTVGGRKKINARTEFIASIAWTLHKTRTGKIKISSTENSQFENISRICLEAAGFEITSDIHRLIIEALKLHRRKVRKFKVQKPMDS